MRSVASAQAASIDQHSKCAPSRLAVRAGRSGPRCRGCRSRAPRPRMAARAHVRPRAVLRMELGGDANRSRGAAAILDLPPKGKSRLCRFMFTDRVIRPPRRHRRQAAARLRRAGPVPAGLGRPDDRLPLLLAGPAAGAAPHPRPAPARDGAGRDRPRWRRGTTCGPPSSAGAPSSSANAASSRSGWRHSTSPSPTRAASTWSSVRWPWSRSPCSRLDGDVDEAFYELEAHVRDHGRRAHRPPGAIPEQREIFVPVRDRSRETDRIGYRRLPAARVASVIHRGPYGGVAQPGRGCVGGWRPRALPSTDRMRVLYLAVRRRADLRVPPGWVVHRDADFVTELQLPVAEPPRPPTARARPREPGRRRR